MTPQSEEWTLANHANAKDLAFFRRRSGKPMTAGIPAFFTVDGYRAHFIDQRAALTEAAGRDTWVLGPDFARFQTGETGAEIVRKAEELYLSDYISAWDGLLSDLELVSPANIEQLGDMLRAVSQPNSPIKNVLQAISAQTGLAAAVRKEERERQLPAGRLDKLQGQIKGWIAPVQAAPSPATDPTERVDAHFRWLSDLVGTEGAAGSPIEATLQPLGELNGLIVQIQQTGNDPKQALDAFRTGFPKASALASQLQAQAGKQPDPVRRWLTGLAGTVSATAVGPQRAEAAKRIQDVWRTSVGPTCRAALDDRYPFDLDAQADVNLSDFARVLGPNGIIEAFSKTYVEPIADTSVRPWRWLDPKDGGLRLSSSSLAMFERAAKIRQAFFSAGSPQPQFSFELEPVSLDSRARQVLLNVGEQSVLYQHGPRRPVRLQWPPQAGPTASVSIMPLDNPNANVGLTRSGPWALFRLIAAGKMTSTAGVDRFRLAFDLDGYKAEFELRADSVINPLYLPELQQFRCPSTL